MYDYGDVDREGEGVKSAGIGSYCLMGSGNHLNFGRTPSPVCAYLRDLAGWCDNEIDLNTPGDNEAVHGDYNTVMKFRTGKPNEYFLVENRSKLGLDTHLPSSGLAVYHCDILGSNELQEGTATKHYQCALLQADGQLHLERNVNQGDGADLFSSVEGIAVSHASTPSTRAWDGADSGLEIANVGVPDDRIGFRVGPATVNASPLRAEATPGLAIPDNSPAGITSTLEITGAGTASKIKVAVDVTHTYIGDLVIELKGPGGQKAVLHNKAGAGTDNLSRSFESGTDAGLNVFIGTSVTGAWVLSVKDLAGQDQGKLNRWSIELSTGAGAAPPARGESSPALVIPDNNPTGVSSSIAIAASGTIKQIKVSVDITHTYIGDLRLTLISPNSRSAVLHAQLGGSQDNIVVTYDSAAPLSPLSAFVGQPMQGNWLVRVADLAKADTGKLNKWVLELTPAS
jgi:subtilisin-like proprotein convertase family protein